MLFCLLFFDWLLVATMVPAATISMMSASLISMISFMMRANNIRVIFQTAVKQFPGSFIGTS